MIDGSEKCNRQLAFELQNSHVCEKRSKACLIFSNISPRNVANFHLSESVWHVK